MAARSIRRSSPAACSSRRRCGPECACCWSAPRREAARAAAGDPAIAWTQGPLAAGAPKAAPFDRIIIEGAVETLPDALVAQLAEGGRIVAARRDGSVSRLVQGVKAGGTVALRAFADMDVAPLPGFAAPKGFRF